MYLRDKQTGEVDEYYIKTDPGHGVINARTGRFIKFNTIAELCTRFEDAPEEIKPFEEVAKVKCECIAPWTNPVVEKIQIADQDYYEILPDGTKKTAFTWDEAVEIEKKTQGKWRVPTQAEWFAIAAAFGRDDDGKVTGETLAKNLNLTTDEGGYGYFWSSTLAGTPYARYLRFDSTGVYPQNGTYRENDLPVRCVAGEGEKNGKV